MEYVKLNASIRNETGKGVARRLRAQKLIPAILYGRAAEKRPPGGGGPDHRA